MLFQQKKQSQAMSIDTDTVLSQATSTTTVIPPPPPQYQSSTPSFLNDTQSTLSAFSGFAPSRPPTLQTQPGQLTRQQIDAICNQYQIPKPDFATPIDLNITSNNIYTLDAMESTAYSPSDIVRTFRRRSYIILHHITSTLHYIILHHITSTLHYIILYHITSYPHYIHYIILQ